MTQTQEVRAVKVGTARFLTLALVCAAVSAACVVIPLFVIRPGSGDKLMADPATGSTWNFQGCAVDGKLAGQCLKEIDAHKDYWFDWMKHQPESSVFKN